jgi:hypothetical protein
MDLPPLSLIQDLDPGQSSETSPPPPPVFWSASQFTAKKENPMTTNFFTLCTILALGFAASQTILSAQEKNGLDGPLEATY